MSPFGERDPKQTCQEGTRRPVGRQLGEEERSEKRRGMIPACGEKSKVRKSLWRTKQESTSRGVQLNSGSAPEVDRGMMHTVGRKTDRMTWEKRERPVPNRKVPSRQRCQRKQQGGKTSA